MKHLCLHNDHPIDAILTAIGPKLKDLSSITVKGKNTFLWKNKPRSLFELPSFHKTKLGQLPFRTMMLEEIVTHIHCDDHFDIILTEPDLDLEVLHIILKHCTLFDIYPSVFLDVSSNFEV